MSAGLARRSPAAFLTASRRRCRNLRPVLTEAAEQAAMR